MNLRGLIHPNGVIDSVEHYSLVGNAIDFTLGNQSVSRDQTGQRQRSYSHDGGNNSAAASLPAFRGTGKNISATAAYSLRRLNRFNSNTRIHFYTRGSSSCSFISTPSSSLHIKLYTTSIPWYLYILIYHRRLAVSLSRLFILG